MPFPICPAFSSLEGLPGHFDPDQKRSVPHEVAEGPGSRCEGLGSCYLDPGQRKWVPRVAAEGPGSRCDGLSQLASPDSPLEVLEKVPL
mmetsp:Transcript_31015/g.56238  ORF Transcript_31015/g.56238 Transcript_31015/m.56238 type:complete len:89 (-) Transcript_31015:1452-1718(-)